MIRQFTHFPDFLDLFKDIVSNNLFSTQIISNHEVLCQLNSNIYLLYKFNVRIYHEVLCQLNSNIYLLYKFNVRILIKIHDDFLLKIKNKTFLSRSYYS